MKLLTGHLPNIHEVVGCPAEDEAQHQDARDLDGLDLGLPDDAGDAVPEDVLGLVGGAEAARPAVSASKSSIRRFVITEKAPTRGGYKTLC